MKTFVFFCLLLVLNLPTFAQSDAKKAFLDSYFHKYGVIKFDLRKSKIPTIDFYTKSFDKQGLIIDVIYKLNDHGFFKGKDLLCKVSEKQVLEPTSEVYRPICQGRKPFTSGYSERTKTPFLEIDYDQFLGDYKNQRTFKLGILDKEVEFKIPDSPGIDNRINTFKVEFLLPGNILNREMISEADSSTSMNTGLVLNHINPFPTIDIYSTPDLKGDVILTLNDQGVWTKGVQVCKTIKNEINEQLLWEVDHDLDNYSYEACKNGRPFSSAYALETSEPYFYVRAKQTAPNSDVWEVVLPDKTKGYFQKKFKEERIITSYQDSLDYLSSYILGKSPELSNLISEVENCILSKNLKCLLDKVDSRFQKEFAQAIKTGAKEYYLLSKSKKLSQRMKQNEKPERILIKHDLLKKYGVKYIYWPSIRDIFINSKSCSFAQGRFDVGNSLVIRYCSFHLLVGNEFYYDYYYLSENSKTSLILKTSIGLLSEEFDGNPNWENLDLDISDIENSN